MLDEASSFRSTPQNGVGGQGNMKKETSSSGENTNSSFFKKSEFLDPLVRINRMKFLTSADIGIANQSRFACLDIRQRKVPKLTEIFKPNNPELP